MRTGLWVVVVAAAVLLAPVARAAVYFVDGACVNSGTGTSVGCGPSGPFRTIGEGILAMHPGDTLNVRGAHGSFDGAYFESLALRDGAPVPGRALACTGSAPCVVQGCRAPACAADEVPTIRGMTRRSNWIAVGGGVFRRTMEATPDADDQVRDAFDPMILVQGTTPPFAMLAYGGDDVTAPADGHWSYQPSTHQVFVNPAGGADPATTVWVPHFTHDVWLQPPTSWVTLRWLTIEGTRSRSIDVDAGSGTPVPGVFLSHLTQRYAHRFFVIATRDTPGLRIEDSLAEYGCRGSSWFLATGDGCYGYRLFGVDGGAMRRNTVRHLGATGQTRLSGPGPWPCAWCDAPWNDPANTAVSATGTAYNVKQTEGFTIEDNAVEDISTVGIDLDVSRNVVVQRNTVVQAGSGVNLRNFTPTGTCPTASASAFCYNSGHLIQQNVISDVGHDNVNHCAITLTGGGTRHVGAAPFLAHVYNNFLSRVGTGGVCIKNEPDDMDGNTPTTGIDVWHNTIFGTRAGETSVDGIIVRNATRNVSVRNNAIDGLDGDGLVVATAAESGVSMDGDVVGSVACQVRWHVPPFTPVPGGGSCDGLAAHEQHGRAGPLHFANPNATPPDLHLTDFSTAIDAGVSVSLATDFDGDTRPAGNGFDSGADEAGGALPPPGSAGNLTDAELRCALRASFAAWKAVGRKSRCVIACERGARAGSTPPADCVAPYDHDTRDCAQRAEQIATTSMCHVCTDAPPVCYAGTTCGDMATGKLAAAGVELDGSFVPAAYCDDAGSADGLTDPEAACQDATLRELGKAAVATARCLTRCRRAERSGSIPAGACDAPVADPTGRTQRCLDRVAERSAHSIDVRCNPAGSGDPPECYGGTSGADWTALAAARVEAHDAGFYCAE